jgi:autotransporter-associated beta strand protein
MIDRIWRVWSASPCLANKTFPMKRPSCQLVRGFLALCSLAAANLAFAGADRSDASYFNDWQTNRFGTFDAGSLLTGGFAESVLARYGTFRLRAPKTVTMSGNYVTAIADSGTPDAASTNTAAFDSSLFNIAGLQPLQITGTKTLDTTVAALGGSATWSTSPTNGNWVPAAGETNWSTGAGNYPGSTSGTTNGDSATFLTSNITTIVLNSAINIDTVRFGTSSATPNSFTIGTNGGNSLLLSNTGQIAYGASNGTSITQTVAAPIVLEPASASTTGTQTFSSSSGSATNKLVISGSVTGGTTTQGIALTLTGANGGANTVSGDISNGGAAGGVSLSKTSSGVWNLTGDNSYSGTTSISGGTLTLNATGGKQALGGTSGVTVTGAGTVLVQSSSDQINNTANMTLSGGTYRLSGVSEGTTAAAGLGSLTLTSNSIIDLSGTDVLHYSTSSTQPWVGTLSIYNWSGTPVTGGGSEQILFGNDVTGLNATQLAMVQFYSGTGTGAYTPGAVILSTGEIVPVPEPSTWAAASIAAAALGLMQRRRLARLIKRAA